MKLISIIETPEQSAQGVTSKPIFTILPDTAMLRNNDPFYIPFFSSNIDARVQLGVKISRVVKSIENRFASRCYDEISLVVSFTARDIEQQLLTSSLPGDMARSFDKSTAISPRFISKSEDGVDVASATYEMSVDGVSSGELRVGDMSGSIDDIISYVSSYTTLKIGDLLLCGAAAPVMSIGQGAVITASLNGEQMLNFEVR